MSTPNQPPAGYPGSQPPLPPPAGPRASGPPQPPPAAGPATTAMPPTPAPGGAAGDAAPPGMRPVPGRPAPGSGDRSGTAWKIATAVLAVTTVVALIWGYMATKNASDTQAQMQSEIDTLKAQVSGEESAAAKKAREAAAELQKYKAQVAALKGSLRVNISDLKSETQQLRKQRAQYEKAQQAAAQQDATLQDQLKAANSKAALAQHCASVMATGLTRLYEDVPDVIDYRAVAVVINAARAPCAGIVTVQK